MSYSDSASAWLALVEVKRKQLIDECDCKFPTKRVDKRKFRATLETLFDHFREYRGAQLEARLLPTYIRITNLAICIDERVHDLHDLVSGDRLAALIWEASYTLIKRSLNAKLSPSAAIGLVCELNRGFPNIPEDQREQFLSSRLVQEPLQTILSLLINSYIYCIDHMARWDPDQEDPRKDPRIQSYSSNLRQEYEEGRGVYGVRFGKAADDLERRRKEFEQPGLSSQRHKPDILHPNHQHRRELRALFVPQRHLGTGSFGDVDMVQEESTGAEYVRKHIHLDTDKPSDLVREEVKNEVAIMQKLRHRHIATVLFYIKDAGSYSIFMLPVADYDLRRYLKICAEESFDENFIDRIYPWFGCLLDALAYAHKEEIRHQDIKPSNILIKNNQPYLSDFGLAKDFEGAEDSRSEVVRRHGTPVYWAPEIQPGNKRSRAADIFSLGCVYTEMFTVTQENSTDEFYLTKNRGRDVRDPPVKFRDCLRTVRIWMNGFAELNKPTRTLRTQILDMIEQDPGERPKAQELVEILKRNRKFFCVE